MNLQKILVGLLLIFLLSGCSNSIVRIGKDQEVREIPFTNGDGHAIVVVERNAVDCMIVADGLKAGEKYTIVLDSDKGRSGVTFGPKENVDLRVGTLQDDIYFVPNSEGELFVSMRNPVRMFEGIKEQQFEIKDRKEKIVMKTKPFQLEQR